MPNFLIAELDYTDINFRIFSAPLDTLLQNTVCAPRRVNAVNAHRFTPIPPNYYDFTSDALSSGYDTSKIVNYSPTTTILTPTPKANIFNQYSALTLKTETPAPTAFYSSNFNLYPATRSSSNYNSQTNNYNQKKNNDWNSGSPYFY
jgi:hypothetical protein